MKIYKQLSYWLVFFVAASFFACKEKSSDNNKQNSPQIVRIKPGATIKDTLLVTTISAIFYEPDSIQLEHIKAANEKNIFDATMHEYESQMRNAKAFFKEHWPQIKIITAKNIRYLKFVRSNGQIELVDLDTKNDAMGLFLFDPTKSAALVDMMNIDTVVPNYFSH